MNTAELAAQAADAGVAGAFVATTDSDLVTALLAARPDLSVEAAAMEVLPQLRGAFSFTFMDEDTLYAARDPQGVRPLVLGRLERGWVVASETAALDIVRRLGRPRGRARRADRHRRERPAQPALRGRRAQGLRLRVRLPGPPRHHDRRPRRARRPRRDRPPAGQGAPGRGRPGHPGAGVGHPGRGRLRRGVAASPTASGLVKNSYVGRTFIQPSQTIRQLGIRLKLNPLRDVIRGKRLVVVDDSIVRGNTQRALIRMLREAGAVEVHVRISSPPVKWPCFYGIDFASRAELIANGLDVDGVRASINADSLGYVSEQGLIAATEQPANRLCTACFTGQYPIPLGEPEVLGKHVLEGIGSCRSPTRSARSPAGPVSRPAAPTRAGRRRGRAHAARERRAVHLRGLRRRHRRRRARRRR